MSHRRVWSHHHGHPVSVGACKPVTEAAVAARPRFGDHVNAAALPAPPPGGLARAAMAALTALLARLLLNDALGDCVIAWSIRLRMLIDALAGTPTDFADAQVVALYGAITGYDPAQTQPDGSNPTDQGTDPLVALDYLAATGWPDGIRLAGAALVDATNVLLLRLAIWLFGGVEVCVGLPDAWLPSDPSFGPATVWDVVPGGTNPANGHCFGLIDYHPEDTALDPNGTFDVSTWGMVIRVTARALAAYAVPARGGLCAALLTPDRIAAGQALSPDGIAWDALRADLAALGPAPASLGAT